MGRVCSAEGGEMLTLSVFSDVLRAFEKEKFRSFNRFGRLGKSRHFKEMAENG